MIVIRLFALAAIGVMSIRQITRFGFVIGVMPFIVSDVMKWTSVRIVAKLFVGVVVHFVAVNSADVDCARIVLRLVDGEYLFTSPRCNIVLFE
jgi:hypothetical protein